MSVDAQALLDNLGSSPLQRNSLMKDARDVLIRTIDQIVSLIQSQSKSKDAVGFATLFLAARSIDDLNCAFHLAQHGYMSQSFSLIRTVVESLDLMELFHRNLKEADDWADDYSKDLERTFKPKEVRLRLGKPAVDPLYTMLCGHGSHPRFEGRHLTSHLQIDSKSGKKKLGFTIGGSLRIKALYQTHFYIVFLAQHLLIAVWQHFGDQIPKTLAGKAFLTLENTAQFLETHLAEMAKEFFKEEGQKEITKMIENLKSVFAGVATLGKKLSQMSE